MTFKLTKRKKMMDLEEMEAFLKEKILKKNIMVNFTKTKEYKFVPKSSKLMFEHQLLGIDQVIGSLTRDIKNKKEIH